MSTAAAGTVTLAEFLRLEAEAPEGVMLEVINGELVERPMTTRNARHSSTIMRIGRQLIDWLDSRTNFIGAISGGEARCRMRQSPELIVGLDVAYFQGLEHAQAAVSGDFFDGPPVAAVEVLSATDTHEDVVDRIRLFLEAGVKQVWIVDPDLRNITIHRANDDATFFAARHTLTAEPELPGLAVPVESLFPPRPTI